MSSESRTELLAWLNDLSKLNYTKIEQCGKGVAHCVIMDSIFRDVPLAKCKFDAKHEYEFVGNFKILQAVFDKHKIDNDIPVERLVKCRFQDNIEFLQMVKKYWDQHYPGGPYDAAARRSHAISTDAKRAGVRSRPSQTRRTQEKAEETPRKSAARSSTTAARTSATSTAAAASGAGVPGSTRKPSASADADRDQLVAVTKDRDRCRNLAADLAKERDFYFNKLREIEIIVQRVTEDEPPEDGAVGIELLKTIQDVMYRAEDGTIPQC
ncbi:calponin homology domain-containing protein [Zopfochytrium polystomum]|nr:calponin homology domain-containing protein [Zopfochytrium polystomum]